MFALFKEGNALGYWRERYCDSEFTRCARFDSMKRGESPPVQLLPSGRVLRLD